MGRRRGASAIASVLLLAASAHAARGVRHPRVLPLPAAERVQLESGSPPVETTTRVRPPAPAFVPPASPRVAPRAIGVVPRVTPALTVLRDTDLKAQLDTHPGVPVEPCATKSGPDVIYTDNFHAMVSTDSGATFRIVDPRRLLPRNADFLGDQSVLYDPAHDVFVWLLAYRAPGAPGGIAIAVAHGQAAFETGDFTVRGLTARALGIGRGAFDFPQMAFTQTSLYVTANVFTQLSSRGRFLGSMIVRIALADLANGAAGTLEVFGGNPDHFGFGLVQGATDTMYFASHAADGFMLRLYRWPEGDAVAFDDLALSPYGTGTRTCAGPDAHEWCGTAGRNVLTGWIANGVIGFMWGASALTPDRPFPYAAVVRIDAGTRAVIDQPDLFSTDYAIQFPNVAVNARGHLGGVVAIGGGSRFPGVATFVQDDLSAPAPGWELHELLDGTSGPHEDRWGDFFCARPDYPGGNTWIMTGYVLRGGDDSYTSAHQHFLRVGRDRDVDCSQTDLCADDGNTCTADACNGAVCEHTALPDGSTCLDADGCTVGETCTAGTCGTGATAACAADACAFETCVPADGCIFPATANPTGLACRFAAAPGTDGACGTLPAAVQRPFVKAAQLVTKAGAAKNGRQASKRLVAVLARLNQSVGAADKASQRGLLSADCLDAIVAWQQRLYVDTVATLDQLQ